MNRRQPTTACVAALLLAAASAGALADGSGQPRVLRAHAVVTEPGGSIQGIVSFRQQVCPGCGVPGSGALATDPAFRNFPEPPVDVVARINGAPGSMLTPGAHGMHIHEVGSCENTATAF